MSFPKFQNMQSKCPPMAEHFALATGTGATRATFLVPFFSLLGSAEFLVRCRLCHSTRATSNFTIPIDQLTYNLIVPITIATIAQSMLILLHRAVILNKIS